MTLPKQYPVTITTADTSNTVEVVWNSRPKNDVVFTTKQVAHHAPGLTFKRSDQTYLTIIPQNDVEEMILAEKTINVFHATSTVTKVKENDVVYIDGVKTQDVDSVPLKGEAYGTNTVYVVVSAPVTEDSLEKEGPEEVKESIVKKVTKSVTKATKKNTNK